MDRTLEQLSHLWSMPRFFPFLGMITGLANPASSRLSMLELVEVSETETGGLGDERLRDDSDSDAGL